jgi:uncharacterized protein (DUF58 family)
VTRPELTMRGWVYAALAVVGPFASLALGDPAPALVALPALLFLVYGALATPREAPELRVETDVDQTVEEARVAVRVEVRTEAPTAHVTLGIPEKLDLVAGRGGRVVERAGLEIPVQDGVGEATVELVAHRWGSYPLGAAIVEVFGPLRILTRRTAVGSHSRLMVLPDPERVRLLVEPLATNMHSGDLVSTARGRGSALAELRPWAPGDSPRSINWRATVRSDHTWVTQRHADRSGDLILVIDSVLEPRSDVEEAVARAVRIAAALVKSYGRGRHRLGLVSLGGYARWFGLDTGAIHEQRLLAAAMATQATPEPVWMAVDRILDHTVRPPSMVVFVSPLLDDGLLGRIRRLAVAGIDVAVLAIDVTGWLRVSEDPLREIARRIWMMEREVIVDRLRQTGVAVVEWRPGRSLDELMKEMEEWRRRLRRARV